MSLSHNLDISSESIWKIHTPSLQTKQLPFFINEIGCFECESNFYTKRNEQRDFEIIYTTDGKGEITYKGVTYLLEKGNAFIIDCYHLHHYKTSGAYWKFNWVHFSGNSAEVYYNYITKNSNLINLKNFNFFDFHFNILLSLSSRQNLTNNFTASQYLLLVLTELYFSNSEILETIKTYSNEIQIILDFIANNYKNQIKLDDLCELIHLSKYYFINVFKDHTGSTPNEYIINYRIGKAKVLLRSTKQSVKDICFNVGFTSESYFIKTFKKLNGITPNKYRLTM
jgi:AraC-like DNA-binding protein